MITRKSAAEIARMRRAGRVVADVLALVEEELRPGVSTARLDALAEAYIRKAGATPSFKGYHGYPSSLCISIDREVVHGIPGDRVVREGQVVSVDAGAILDGWHGDAARTFVVGDAPPAVRDLVEATRRALDAGIAAAVPGNRVWDVSAAVEDVALGGGYGVVRPYVGHGIGTAMHEEPQVPNYRTKTRGIELAPGICLAIEPMFTLGSADVETRQDGWTVVTRDGSIAAHWEDSIAVTEQGPEVLTRP
ncbi:MAG: type I methionyl aminopeptidase [Chloroflexi bacterium]|nr:type I methionyl aminopeptidase [Chloroflexota bacterium]